VPSFVVVDNLTWLMKIFLNSQQIQNQAVKTRKRTRDPDNNTSTERPRKRLSSQVKQVREKRPREDEVPLSHVPAEPSTKRARTSTAPVRKTIDEARIEFWRENGTWPTEEQEKTIDRFRDIVQHALARKRSKSSLRRKRLDASIITESVQTRSPSD
jgi:hypothetical protein